MYVNSLELQERQVINIADGRCLGDIQDIELDLEEGVIRTLVLSGMDGEGFFGLFQHQGELCIPWSTVVRIGVDVVLIDCPELAEPRSRKKRQRREEPRWQQEVQQYQEQRRLQQETRELTEAGESAMGIGEMLPSEEEP